MLSNILSNFRKVYQSRLIFRAAILAISVALLFLAPEQYDILSGFSCFDRFSFFHVMWFFWMFDMITQLVPSHRFWPLGSKKFLKAFFQPLKDMLNTRAMIEYLKKSRRDALLVGGVWIALTAAIAIAYFTGTVNRRLLLLCTVVFYVCDIICVLYWCPFRVWFMKNRCCTTCRIFNWDHLMMFTPLLFIPGVYTWSLCLMSITVFLVWEISFAHHPERFWDGSNTALTCSNCTDRLCGERSCRVDVPGITNINIEMDDPNHIH